MTTTPPPMSLVAEQEQRAFRVLLDVMSRPGRVGQLPQPRGDDGRAGSALVALQALLDHEVTFHVVDDTDAHERILRRTGARSAPLAEADFVLVEGARATDVIRQAREGDIETPEQGATVVVIADRLGEGSVHLELSGPGVDGTTTLAIAGVPAEAFEALRERTAMFPEGIDLIVVDQQQGVAGIPRSTRLEIGE